MKMEVEYTLKYKILRSPPSADRRYIPSQGFAGAPGHYRVTPSGLFPSRRVRPTGSFVAGMPADEKVPLMTSFRAWCLAVLPGADLHVKLWRPRHIDKCVVHED